MNPNDRRMDAALERLLERGQPHDDTLLNELARTRPKADHAFQQQLQDTLMARLRARPVSHREEHMLTMPLRARRYALPPLAWAAAAVAIALAAVFLFILNTARLPRTAETPLAAGQVDQPRTLLVAAQDIPAGTVITESMVAAITLSPADVEALGISPSGEDFLTGVQAAVGQAAAVPLDWFQPIAASLLQDAADCDQSCSVVPEGYLTIGLTAQPDTLQGLRVGDRVDVLGFVDGAMRALVSDVVLAEVRPALVTLAARPWQLGVLLYLNPASEAYALRLHTGETPAPDETPVEYTLTAPEPLPEDYAFDLIVSLPAAQGYLLTVSPVSIDHLEFSSNGNTLRLWFKDLEVVGMDGRTVTIRLRANDAAALDYLIEQDVELTFVPDAGASLQP